MVERTAMELSENIKEMLGNDFKDELTAEEILKLLNDKKIADLGSGKYVSTAKHQAELDDEKKKTKALNEQLKEKLTEEEKRELEVKAEREKFLEDKKKLNKQLTDNVFAAAGFSADEYSVLSDDLEPELAKKIAEMMTKKTEALNSEIKELKLKAMADPQGGDGVHIDKKYSEMSLDEKVALKKKDPKAYERLKNAE